MGCALGNSIKKNINLTWPKEGHGGNGNESGGILSNRLSLPLPLTACHRCDVCGKLLSTKLTLKRHKEQQHLQPLNNAVCNLCHKVFRTLNSLNNHKSIYHRRQKHHLYSAHPASQALPPHHLSQMPQPANATKIDFMWMAREFNFNMPGLNKDYWDYFSCMCLLLSLELYFFLIIFNTFKLARNLHFHKMKKIIYV